MRFNEGLFSRKRRGVVTCLLLALRISVGVTTQPECKDFGLRNIIGDGGNWLFYKFTDQTCFICLDGRRMSSFDDVLILPCLHPEQPAGSRVIVTNRIYSNQRNDGLSAFDSKEQCETEYANATHLTGEPMEMDGDDDIKQRVRSFVVRKGQYLLKPSNDFTDQSIICVVKVEYENVRFANDTIGTTPSSTSTTIRKSTTSSKSPDSVTQTSREYENKTSREDGQATTFEMRSEESSADSDSEGQGRSDFPIWWVFFICPVITVGLVALVLFGICGRKRIKRKTNSKSKEKENMFTRGIAVQSDENEDRESSNEGTTYNPVYGNNEINDDPKTTPDGQQSLAAGDNYQEIRKQESINGEMIYNSAYEGLPLKGEDAMLTDAAYATVSEINSRKRPSFNRSHKAEQNSKEVAENHGNGHAAKKSIPRENMVVYETAEETEEGNKDRESRVDMIYNCAYADLPSDEKGDFKRGGDYSVVEGINSGEGSLYSRIDDKGKVCPKNVAVNDGRAPSEDLPLYGKLDKTKKKGRENESWLQK